jgi:hypothetical protein
LEYRFELFVAYRRAITDRRELAPLGQSIEKVVSVGTKSRRLSGKVGK